MCSYSTTRVYVRGAMYLVSDHDKHSFDRYAAEAGGAAAHFCTVGEEKYYCTAHPFVWRACNTKVWASTHVLEFVAQPLMKFATSPPCDVSQHRLQAAHSAEPQRRGPIASTMGVSLASSPIPEKASILGTPCSLRRASHLPLSLLITSRWCLRELGTFG